MTRRLVLSVALILVAANAFAQVEFDTMTWPEVKQALADGKTTALFYTGGTEQRGPQAVNGGHTLMAKATVKAIALKLGNAIAMPVLPFTVNDATAQFPGTIGLSSSILASVLRRVTEQAIVTGFKNVVLMGDHGGGQPAVYRDVAASLDKKYAASGVHVYYCGDVYTKAEKDFDDWLAAHGYPRGTHASIADTSEMLYLGGDAWVRKDQLKTAVGPANGISGDARRSSEELGKMAFDMKVDDAVKQIQAFVAKR